MLLFALTDTDAKLQALRNVLGESHVVQGFSRTGQTAHEIEASPLIVDVDLRHFEWIERVRNALRGVGNQGTRVFVVDVRSRVSVAQAFSLGATSLASDYVDIKRLISRPGETVSTHPAVMRSEIVLPGDDPARSDIVPGRLFESIFSGMLLGAPLDYAASQELTTRVIDAVEELGLASWIDDVRRHHEGTFQHCMLVTGVAVDFGLSLGFSSSDVRRLGLAATLHDVGKACIPASILDKPGRLDDDERSIMEGHPVLGYEALAGVQDITSDVLGAVRSHHEFLDGSGYPDRLRGGQISDLVRILTISDIFAALIERRSYKPAMPRERAYQILCDMEGKLEGALLRAFRDVAVKR